MRKIFDENFTQLYSLSKTLRFELRPIGETLENMRQHFKYDQDLQTFLVDQEIENAYLKLKPIFDALHEEFITESLESEASKTLDFSQYYSEYKKRADLKILEASLRAGFTSSYATTATAWKNRIGKNEKGKEILAKKGYKILTERGILDYIKKNAEKFLKISPPEEILTALERFEGFFTYFTGFNQNRENYYETKKETATSVASRIVHDNLPKFCDNSVNFESRFEEYLTVYNTLKEMGIDLVNKSGEALTPISKEIFQITHYNFCFSQSQIDRYNQEIGNENLLINLYNQAKKESVGFKKLSLFKTLYKQIGCGKRESLFFAITHDKKTEAEKIRKEGKEAFSVEEVLALAKKAGEKYFQGRSNDGVMNTIPEFLDYILTRANYSGIYWSKMALNTISNKYFANWHELKDKMKWAKVFDKAKKGSDDDVKVPDAIELEGFFKVLDETENWKKMLFKDNVLEDKAKIDIINTATTPSKALLSLIFADIEHYAAEFQTQSEKILKLEEYRSSESKERIKVWLDNALSLNQMIKYFLVKENKVKGTQLDASVAEALKVFLRSPDAEWFTWYDAVRNYLTKKPQDNVKENKLKLNFENGSLLGGWSDGQEKIKSAVLLQKNKKYYLAILRKKSLFDTTNLVNPLYKNVDVDAGRLILANLKFQTLAGKGFLGEFKKSYGEMGKENPKEAMFCLQKIIRDRYAKKYPLLERIANTSYEDKKGFDKDIQETLKECYVCGFTPINWSEVEIYDERGDLYLFEISSKDFLAKSGGNKDLQSLYWNSLFEDNSPFQLNGGGEIFYRKAAINQRKTKKGYEEKSYIIENKRFTAEKFLFHCPIKLNYKAKSYSKLEYALPEINKLVTSYFSLGNNVYFLGIDRGEKHLAYYSLVNQNGEIVLDANGNPIQGTLNMPFVDKDGKARTVKAEKRTIGKDQKEQLQIVECSDYNDLLEARAGDRDYARKNWQAIGTIKELKDGYISQVVRKVADLAVQYNAFIVLEDLNTGFKRGRQKIEKSVYQKFELALAKKLNFLVDKSAKNGEIGSVTNALQLTPPVANYGDIENRKQLGIMLYTRANYTSQTDPVTGWRKSVYLKKSSEDAVKKQIVEKFTDIGFDGKDYFLKYTDENTQKTWTLYSGKDGKSLDRFRGKRGKDKNEWIIESENIVEILDGIFANFDKNRSILSQIKEGIELVKKGDHTAWESLRYAIELIQQIRNTGELKQDNDFILSPVRDHQGNHFDSRHTSNNRPTSGDANGAFNIARKGIVMNEHIKKGYGLYVSDAEWDAWLAGEEQWNAWLKNNEKDLMPLKKK